MSDETNNTGAWVITDVFSKHGIRITLKASAQNVAAAVDDLYNGIKHGVETYGWAIEQVNAPRPATAAPQDSPKPTQSTETADTGMNTLEVVRVEVTPKPDGKAELKLYSEGHKYPDLYHNGTIKQLLAALSVSGYGWTEEMLKTSQSFDLRFFADWRNSEKLNQNGKPYKNIVGYRAIDATA